ncbi:M20/M25/M40 family metallo-hydrolase [Tichowtungia aerotolerans]|uniref:M20/M25/M40 family metallo-hydrolase n=1 Tax=Tichowtungia aerotolerans TaxID=2697043 RepID=A0A6P1M501_9BACT|nr:M20/M25/M40 family metallo-hydrolase [Tichowtungia aerotolerans]QHI69660.1 M20/M25/M40 family metallo-hydrolase [Tichowtungia aerotolerans]
MNINEKQAISNLMELLAAEGPSGGEGPVAELVKKQLMAAGAKESWFSVKGKSRLPKNFTVGNLVVKIPGTIKAPRIMFSAHLDTVPICQGAVPVLKGDLIVPKGKTGLGGDNRASVAAVVTMAQTILQNDLPRPPITLLFTVGEENGLYGAKAFRPQDGGNPSMCFNIDGSGERGGVIGALGANRWRAEIHGISVHAANNPEGGVSAAIIAANAIAEIKANGYFGRIDKGSIKGTANVGSLHGGEADNQVMDSLTVTGECRSHNPTSLKKISKVWKTAFEKAAADLKNAAGECGAVDFIEDSDYRSFKLKKSDPVVKRFLKAAPKAGREAKVQTINAGLDANILNESGVPTVTFDAGNDHAHSLDECVHIPRYLEGCRLATALATEV